MTLSSAACIQGVNLWVRGKKAARLPFEHLGEGLTRFPFVLDFAQDQHEQLLGNRLAALGVRVERDTELRRSSTTRTASVRHFAT